MKLLVLSVFVPIFVLGTAGQQYQDQYGQLQYPRSEPQFDYERQYEVPPPLPTPNYEVIKRFEMALEAVFGVGVRLQTFLRNDDENFLVSPISAAVVIGQLLLGAEGEFRKQLVELLAVSNSHRYENDTISYHNSNKKKVTYFLPYSNLHLQLSNLLKTLESGHDPSKHFILTEKSALFVDDRIVLNDIFEKLIKVLYETNVHRMDFAGDPLGTQRNINAWVTNSTNGLIKSILSSPPSPITSAIFANAIYFKAQWKIPFSDMLNRNGSFNVSATRMVPVTYMINQLDQIMYAESSEYRIIALPYTNEELGMYIMMPKPTSQYKYDMKGFLQFLKYAEVLDTVKKAKRRNVVVKIPKMTLSTSLSIIDQLKKYRVFEQQAIKLSANNSLDKLEEKVDKFDSFTPNVNREDIFLSGAAIGESLRIDDIVQKVVISINEKGTEAAAVSAATIDYMGGAKNFIIDRPFVFFIRHEATSATLFWGAVTNPTA